MSTQGTVVTTPKARQGTIYALTDGGVVYYVGQTANIDKRYAQHCSLAQNMGKTKKQEWIRGLLLSGRSPKLVILEEAEDADQAEIKWIKHYRTVHGSLTNTSDGGRSMTSLHRAKKSKPWGKGHSPLQKILISFKADIKFAQRHNMPKMEAKAKEHYRKAMEIVAELGHDTINQRLWEKHGNK